MRGFLWRHRKKKGGSSGDSDNGSATGAGGGAKEMTMYSKTVTSLSTRDQALHGGGVPGHHEASL